MHSQVNVYIYVQQVPVSVDNSFLTSKGGKRLTFVGINKNSRHILPVIIEKVCEKCNKSYEDIIKGTSVYALKFLTPASVETHYHKSGNFEVFNVIKKTKEKKLHCLN